MRTTVTFDRDVESALRRLRRERGLGVSEAVNELVRAGLAAGRHSADRPQPFRQPTATLDLRIDVSNVAEALEQLDGPAAR
jgi:hypothetical protein